MFHTTSLISNGFPPGSTGRSVAKPYSHPMPLQRFGFHRGTAGWMVPIGRVWFRRLVGVCVVLGG